MTAFLDELPQKRRTLYDVWIPAWDAVPLPPDELARTQALYKRVYEIGGAGSTHAQEGMLALVAVAASATSIPFWLEMLDLSRPRDTFARQRRDMALAALALLAIRRATPEAYTALREAAHHSKSDVRALAVYYLGHAYLVPKCPLPDEVQRELWNMAVNDRAYAPRFQARDVLWRAELPVPEDNPGGVYAFQVWYRGMKKEAHRTIELRSGQTLLDLHRAIQRAFRWDSDHLYSFYMNGERYDERYAFACPYEEDRLRGVDEITLGELGLTLRHKFLYHFDYGDDHLFEVKVVGIYPQAEKADYPRVVESHGPAPKQYGRW